MSATVAPSGGKDLRPEDDPLLRDQVSRLTGVLRQLAAAKTAPVRHTAQYHAALWLADVRDHCAVKVPEGPGEELLRAARVPREPEPAAPPAFAGRIRRPSASDEVPDLELDEGEQDAPDVEAEFAEWMRTSWQPWAERERRRRPAQRVYETLF